MSDEPHRQQAAQERAYDFPYHHVPQLDGGTFQQHLYWSWGYRYFGGMHVAATLMGDAPFDSLLDVGCGDGRFIAELARNGCPADLVGVDYSRRAIELARAMAPGVDYRAADIVREPDALDGRRFDIVTLIEVIEHIPPDELEAFAARCVDLARPGGRVILTVPHKNKPVEAHHFQHFDTAQLRALFGPHLRDIRFQPFDPRARLLHLWWKLMGGFGRHYLITHRRLLASFYQYYVERCLFTDDEATCTRIAMVGVRPADWTREDMLPR